VLVAERGLPPHKPHHRSGIDKAWDDSIGGFVGGFEWVVRAAGPALFILISLAALSLLGRWVWRSARRSRI